MATFFGEVIDARNRAYDDQEDDTESSFETHNQLVAHVLSPAQNLSCEILLFSTDEFTKVYIESLLSSKKDSSMLFCVVYKSDADSANPPCLRRKSLCEVFAITDRVFAAVSSTHIPVELSHWLIETVLSRLSVTKETIVMTSAPLSSFMRPYAKTAHETLSDCHLVVRLLSTPRTAGTVDCCSLLPLEPPNMVSDLPASVFEWCMVNDMDATVVRLFVPVGLRIDSELVEECHHWITKLDHLPQLQDLRPDLSFHRSISDNLYS